MPSLVTKKHSTDYGDIIYYWFQYSEQSKYIVFIHGLGGNRKWFASDFVTYELDKHSWIVPDLMGYGDSSKHRNASAYTMMQQAEFILGILEHEGVEEISIIAHSMGGPIAISLIEKLATNKSQKINVVALLYLEGNLDAGDAFISSRITAMPIDEFEEGFESWCTNILAGTRERSLHDWIDGVRDAGPYVIWESSKDCAHLSKSGNLLNKLKIHLDFPIHFIFGERNKGQYTSEKLVREAGLPIHFIPNAGHAMFRDNPIFFWKLVENILQ